MVHMLPISARREFSLIICSRANRAQYDDITFVTVREEDIGESALPSMQGEEDEEGLTLYLAVKAYY